MKQLHARALLAVLVSLCGLGSATLAYAETVSYTVNIPSTKTNWSKTVTFPRLASASGTLSKVTLTLTSRINGTLHVESVDANPTTVTSDVSARVKLLRSGGSPLVVTIPNDTHTDMFSAADGTVDFAGTSGTGHTITARQTGSTVLSDLSAEDRTVFQGEGSMTLPITADGISSFTGGGNLRSESTLFAEATVNITYTYLVPDLQIALVAGDAAIVGQQSTIVLTVNNAGTGPTLGPTEVSSLLPAGLSFAGVTGTDWSCTANGQLVTCTTAHILGSGKAFPPIRLITTVQARALPVVVLTASVSQQNRASSKGNANGSITLSVSNPAPTQTGSRGSEGAVNVQSSQESISSADSSVTADVAPKQVVLENPTTPNGVPVDAQGCPLPEAYAQPHPIQNTCFIYRPQRPIILDDIDGTPQRDAIELLKSTEIQATGDFIISGVGNHSTGKQQEEFQSGTYPYEPSRLPTRLEVVKMALISNCIPVEDDPFNTETTFTDIPQQHDPDTAQDFIARVFYTAAKHGIVTGYEDGSAKPLQIVSKPEALAILLRASGVMPKGFLLPSDADWSAGYMSVAKANHIDDIAAGINEPFDRASLSALIVHMMALSPNPAISGYIAQTEPMNRTFTPLELHYLPIVQTADLAPDTTLRCEDRAPTVNACLALNADRALTFDDVPVSDRNAKFINVLKNSFILATGDYIVSGVGNHSTGKQQTIYKGGTWEFQPAAEATRLEVIKTALVANCIPVLDYIPSAGVVFTDVPATRSPDDAVDFTSRVIYTAALHGIVTGYEDKSIRPLQKATQLETLTILLRAADAVPKSYAPTQFSVWGLPYVQSAWYAKPVAFAVQNGLLGDMDALSGAGNAIRRDTLAGLLVRIMRYSSDPQVRTYRNSVDSLVK